jgi:hypothetical protein
MRSAKHRAPLSKNLRATADQLVALDCAALVWQKGILPFWESFDFFLSSVVNYVLPALIMQFALPAVKPPAVVDNSGGRLKHGGIPIAFLFLVIIVTAVSCHNFLHIPPAFGMMEKHNYSATLGAAV